MYDMIVYFEDGGSTTIDAISPDEIADFVELYADAEGYTIHPVEELGDNGGPDGGLEANQQTLRLAA